MKKQTTLGLVALAALLWLSPPALAQDAAPAAAPAGEPAAAQPAAQPAAVPTAQEPAPAPAGAPGDAAATAGAASETPAAPAKPVSPEILQVQELQRTLPTGDKIENLKARIDAGAKIPLSVIGEGAAEAPQVYIVKQGDTLWDISARFLNNPFLWTKIHSENPQIVNPDLIYPNEPITVYPKEFEAGQAQVVQLLPPPELERAPDAAPEAMQEEAAPVAEFEQIEEVQPTVQETAERTRFLEELTKRPQIKVLDESATELISRKRASLQKRRRNSIESGKFRSAGWVEFVEDSELSKSGYILGQENAEGRIRAAANDVVYINRGKLNGVAKGDRYQVFRIGGEVVHPKSGDYLGHKILIVGVLEVREVQERTSSALILEAFQDIGVGSSRFYGLESYDRIMPEISLDKHIDLKPSDKEISGFLVATREKRITIADNEVVYLDIGSEKGVEVGNVFNIYRPNREVPDPEVGDSVNLPDLRIGQLVVIRTMATTSTAFVTETRQEVRIGDKVSIANFELVPEDDAQAPAKEVSSLAQ